MLAQGLDPVPRAGRRGIHESPRRRTLDASTGAPRARAHETASAPGATEGRALPPCPSGSCAQAQLAEARGAAAGAAEARRQLEEAAEQLEAARGEAAQLSSQLEDAAADAAALHAQQAALKEALAAANKCAHAGGGFRA